MWTRVSLSQSSPNKQQTVFLEVWNLRLRRRSASCINRSPPGAARTSKHVGGEFPPLFGNVSIFVSYPHLQCLKRFEIIIQTSVVHPRMHSIMNTCLCNYTLHNSVWVEHVSYRRACSNIEIASPVGTGTQIWSPISSCDCVLKAVECNAIVGLPSEFLPTLVYKLTTISSQTKKSK